MVAMVLALAASVSAKPGDCKDLGGGWDKVGGMAALDGKLYAISGGKLWVVETR
jgi:flagellar basal body P-ring protein FlgI